MMRKTVARVIMCVIIFVMCVATWKRKWIYSFFVPNDKNFVLFHKNIALKSKGLEKDLKVKESYYTLDVMNFFSKPENDKQVYVTLQVSLGYLFNDMGVEKRIAKNRDLINQQIRILVGQQTYDELKSSEYREYLKVKLMQKVNKIMKSAVTNIYYTQFFIITQKLDY